MPGMLRGALLLLLTILPALAAAQEGHYRVDGLGPEGVYRGSAQIEGSRRGLAVSMRAFDSRVRELRYSGKTTGLTKGELRVVMSGKREDKLLPPLRVVIKPVPGDDKALSAIYLDNDKKVIRRESWIRTRIVEIPLVVITLESDSKTSFQGVPADEAEVSQRRIEAQLNTTFKPVGVRFRALRDKPWAVPGDVFDRNKDGRLGKDEVALLQGALERRGFKQPGRVVVVLTDAPFAHPGCRGWTPGDAPATPHSLTDPNDNLSIVGRAYLSPARFHTVAHEVGHQLGLDDLYTTNRGKLEDAKRHDHLMESGGRGFHLDAAILKILRRHTAGFPNAGLEGRIDREPIGSRRRSSSSVASK